MLSNRGISLWGCCCPEELTAKSWEKHEKLSYSSETLLRGQQGVSDFMSTSGMSAGIMQMRAFYLCFQKLIAALLA